MVRHGQGCTATRGRRLAAPGAAAARFVPPRRRAALVSGTSPCRRNRTSR